MFFRCYRFVSNNINSVTHRLSRSKRLSREFASFCYSEMDSQLPVVVVLGSTGTGKSDLAIDIALRFGGEIISADSMQVYQGLDIVTNKVSPSQIAAVPHHLINFVDPLSNYTVVDFRNQALPIIQRIQQDGKIPIIVGGTNYYIESLLWKVLVTDKHKDSESESSSEEDCRYRESREISDEANVAVDHPVYQSYKQTDIHAIPNEVLHQHLFKVDPDMAGQLHPNNRRKVLRSLQVFEQLGRQHSLVLLEQKSLKGGSSLGGPLRFSKVHIIWIRCGQPELVKKLDSRVDVMLENGLVQELSDFHRDYNKQRLAKDSNSDPDYTKGIFQSIGFKEFHSYLVLSDEERETNEGQKLLKEGIEMMKIATRRYARKQTKWIVNRFLKCPDRQVPPVYSLDVPSMDSSSRSAYVTTPALTILQDLLEAKIPSHLPLQVERSTDVDKHTQRKCTLCNCIVQGHNQWQAHVKSRRHKILQGKNNKTVSSTPATASINDQPDRQDKTQDDHIPLPL